MMAKFKLAEQNKVHVEETGAKQYNCVTNKKVKSNEIS